MKLSFIPNAFLSLHIIPLATTNSQVQSTTIGYPIFQMSSTGPSTTSPSYPLYTDVRSLQTPVGNGEWSVVYRCAAPYHDPSCPTVRHPDDTAEHSIPTGCPSLLLIQGHHSKWSCHLHSHAVVQTMISVGYEISSDDLRFTSQVPEKIIPYPTPSFECSSCHLTKPNQIIRYVSNNISFCQECTKVVLCEDIGEEIDPEASRERSLRQGDQRLAIRGCTRGCSSEE